MWDDSRPFTVYRVYYIWKIVRASRLELKEGITYCVLPLPMLLSANIKKICYLINSDDILLSRRALLTTFFFLVLYLILFPNIFSTPFSCLHFPIIIGLFFIYCYCYLSVVLQDILFCPKKIEKIIFPKNWFVNMKNPTSKEKYTTKLFFNNIFWIMQSEFKLALKKKENLKRSIIRKAIFLSKSKKIKRKELRIKNLRGRGSN